HTYPKFESQGVIGFDPLTPWSRLITVTLQVTKTGAGVQLPSFAVSVPWAPNPDITAPTIISTDPEDGQTGVDAGTTPSVYFSEKMDPTTLGLFLFDSGSSNVPGSSVLGEDGRTATFTPDNPLDGGTYQIRVQGGTSGW